MKKIIFSFVCFVCFVGELSAQKAVEKNADGTLTGSFATGNKTVTISPGGNLTNSGTLSGNGTYNLAGGTVALPASVTGGNATFSPLAGSSSLVTTGTLTSGATGAGFTIALGTAAVTGPLPAANLPAFTGGNVTSSAGSAVLTIGASQVTNAMLAGSIAYGKLSLTGAILNADLAGSIAYSKLSLTGAILNADLAGSIAASKLVGTDIATLGTITAGTWNSTVIAGQYGGTGVTNTGKSITIGGNLTLAGAFNFTGNVTANTTVTFPTSGTLSTLAGAESLTSKKLGSLTSNGLVTTSGSDGTLSVTVPGSNVLIWLATPSGANLASALTSALTTDKGGTGLTSFTSGGLMQASSTSALTTTLTPSGLTSIGATSFLGAILDSNAATDTLIKRNGTTGITLGASSVVTFAGSLTGPSTSAVDWVIKNGGTDGRMNLNGSSNAAGGQIILYGSTHASEAGNVYTFGASYFFRDLANANLATLTTAGLLTISKAAGGLTVSSTTSGTSTTAAAILGKSMGLTENLFVGGTSNVVSTSTAGALLSSQSTSASGYSDIVFKDHSGTIQGEFGWGNSGSAALYASSVFFQTSSGPFKFIGGSTLLFSLSIAGVAALTNATEATTGGAGSLTTAGGIYATKALISGSATASTTFTTGGIIGAGGLGLSGAANVGTYISAGTAALLTGTGDIAGSGWLQTGAPTGGSAAKGKFGATVTGLTLTPLTTTGIEYETASGVKLYLIAATRP